MFMSEPLHPDAKSETVTLSCPTETSFTYGFAILFNWDEKVQKPFKIFPRKAFSTDDIRDRCYEKVLVDEMRIRKLKPLKPLPGQKMSLFAKVESCKYKKKSTFLNYIKFVDRHILTLKNWEMFCQAVLIFINTLC